MFRTRPVEDRGAHVFRRTVFRMQRRRPRGVGKRDEFPLSWSFTVLSLVGARLNGQTYTAAPRWKRTHVNLHETIDVSPRACAAAMVQSGQMSKKSFRCIWGSRFASGIWWQRFCRSLFSRENKRVQIPRKGVFFSNFMASHFALILSPLTLPAAPL